MGIETKAVRDLMNEEDGVEPLLGQRRRDKRSLPYPEETEFRCQNYLKNPGDLAVLDMQGTFDKEGFYHVVSRYAIIPESVTKK
ncbi:hypothetical protein [Desulfovibrio piger]|uniref:Uncharacterized protein n=1 Tax=Desulfovibrio piger TaxID=901 RepID=A0A848CEZ0_9BACT|nr:hypothetical protein [Desulfovibrio piger]NME53145.1 hypothetical protein [Desulfovibrio piger]